MRSAWSTTSELELSEVKEEAVRAEDKDEDETVDSLSLCNGAD